MASFFRSRDKASPPPAESQAAPSPTEHFEIERDAVSQSGIPPEYQAIQAEPGQQPDPVGAPLDPAVLEQIAALRTKLHETFGKVALALMTVPRYRHLPIGDMTTLILDLLIRDRIAMATPRHDGCKRLVRLRHLGRRLS